MLRAAVIPYIAVIFVAYRLHTSIASHNESNNVYVCPSGFRYNDELNPTLTNEFATAAFRVGHTFLPDILPYRGFDLSGEGVGDFRLEDVSYTKHMTS